MEEHEISQFRHNISHDVGFVFNPPIVGEYGETKLLSRSLKLMEYKTAVESKNCLWHGKATKWQFHHLSMDSEELKIFYVYDGGNGHFFVYRDSICFTFSRRCIT